MADYIISGSSVSTGSVQRLEVGDVIPHAAELYDLGTAEKPFRDLHVSSGSIKMYAGSTEIARIQVSDDDEFEFFSTKGLSAAQKKTFTKAQIRSNATPGKFKGGNIGSSDVAIGKFFKAGIGINTPINQKLHVMGGGDAQIRISSNETDDASKLGGIIASQYNSGTETEGFMLLQGFSNQTTNRIDIGGGHSGINAAEEIKFHTAANSSTRTGTERMVITNAGNIGIGVAAPSSKLHIIGSSSSGASTPVHIVGGTGSSAGGLKIGAYNGSFGGIWSGAVTPATSNYALVANATRTVLNAATDIAFYISDSTNNFYMNSTGVGIGDTSPSYKLDVNGTGRFVGTLTTAAITTTGITSTGNVSGSATSTGSFGHIQTKTTGHAQLGYALVGDWPNSATYAFFGNKDLDQTAVGNYALTQHINGTTYLNAASGTSINFRINNSTKMRLNSSGNLGIANNSPTEKLDVGGNIKASGNISGLATSTGSFGRVSVVTAKNGVNIGVIPSTWTSELNILGTQSTTGIKIQAPSSGDAQVKLYSNNGGSNNDFWYIQATNGGTFDIVNYGPGSFTNMVSIAANTGNMTVRGNVSGSSTSTGSFGHGHFDGHVGIGTDKSNSDQYTVLHLDANGADNNLLVKQRLSINGTLQGSLFGFQNAIGFLDGDNSYAYRHITDSSHEWRSNNTILMILQPGGGDMTTRLGIGVDSPHGTLHVNSSDVSGVSYNASADNLIVEHNNDAGISILTPNNKIGAIYFGDPQDDNIGMLQYNHSTNKMLFTTAATSNPVFSLSSNTAEFGTDILKVSGSSISTGSFGKAFLDGALQVEGASPGRRGISITGGSVDGTRLMTFTETNNINSYYDAFVLNANFGGSGATGNNISLETTFNHKYTFGGDGIFETTGHISGSATSTGSFGELEVDSNIQIGQATLKSSNDDLRTDQNIGIQRDPSTGISGANLSHTRLLHIYGSSYAQLRLQVAGTYQGGMFLNNSSAMVTFHSSYANNTSYGGFNWKSGGGSNDDGGTELMRLRGSRLGIMNSNPPKTLTVGGDISASGDFLGKSTSTGSFGYLSVPGDAIIGGTITAEKIITNVVSQSISYASGSNIFGDDISDKHEFSGSLNVSGSITLNGSSVTSGGGGGGGVTISNNDANRVLTGDGTNAVANSDLLWNGTKLTLNSYEINAPNGADLTLNNSNEDAKTIINGHGGNGTFTVGESKAHFISQNVGIGATSIDSESLLHLKGNEPNIFFEDDDDNQDWRLYASSAFMVKDVTNNREVMRLGTAEAVFNEGGADLDFRIESDTNANAFYFEGSTGNIGFGTAPAVKFQLYTSTHGANLLTQYTAENDGGTAKSVYTNLDPDADSYRIYMASGGTGLEIKPDAICLHEKVGIGTTSPGAKLDIIGDTDTWAGMAKIYLTDVNSNAGSRNWSIGNGGTAYGALSFIVSNAADGVPADSTGTAVMSMDGVNKRVGIGTSSPAELLHINAGSSNNAFMKISTTGTGEAGLYIDGDDGDFSGHWTFIGVDNTNNNLTFNNVGADDIIFKTTNAERVRIDASGNVGIGNTSPIDLLDLRTDPGSTGQPGVATTGADSNNAIRITSTGNAVNEKVGIAFGGYSGYVHGGIYGVGDSTSNNTSGDITFDLRTAATDTAFTEVMRVTHEGNIGIGATNPGATLPSGFVGTAGVLEIRPIASGADAGLFLRRYDGDAVYGLDLWTDTNAANSYIDQRGNLDAANLFIRTKTHGTPVNAITIKGSGNVGIGTTSPAGKLDVRGTTTGSMFHANASADAGSPEYSFGQDADTGMYWGGANVLGFSTAGTVRFTLNSGAFSSQVTGGARITPTNGVVASPAFTFNDDTDTGMYRAAANELGFAVGGTARMKIDTGVHVYTDDSTLSIVDAGTNAIQVKASAGDELYLGSNNSYQIQFDTSGNLILNAPLRATNGSAGAPSVTFGSDTDTGMYRVAANTIGFAIGGSEKARIDSTGVTITGKLSATSKSFLINHPTKENKKLQYASLEGPENGVYVRGKIEGDVIELPDYWTGLVHDDSITVNLTPIGKYQHLFVKEIKDNKVFIECFGSSEIKCFYTIYGERKDIEKLEVEF